MDAATYPINPGTEGSLTVTHGKTGNAGSVLAWLGVDVGQAVGAPVVGFPFGEGGPCAEKSSGPVPKCLTDCQVVGRTVLISESAGEREWRVSLSGRETPWRGRFRSTCCQQLMVWCGNSTL
jgi:hypothetical protein